MDALDRQTALDQVH